MILTKYNNSSFKFQTQTRGRSIPGLYNMMPDLMSGIILKVCQ